MTILNDNHPRFNEFIKRLKVRLCEWDCRQGWCNCAFVMLEMGFGSDLDIKRTLKFFKSNGCECDCGVRDRFAKVKR
jgi:hypothetical protein